MKDRLTIITGGQTGVDRGAFRGAVDAGFVVGGYMPKDQRDEVGFIPKEIRDHLLVCPVPGKSARTIANLEMCNALLVIVPDRTDPMATPGTKLTLLEARTRRIPREIIDPDIEDLNLYAMQLDHWARVWPVTKLMIAGPRASKWPNGEYEAAAVVRKLGLALDEIAKRKAAHAAHR